MNDNYKSHDEYMGELEMDPIYQELKAQREQEDEINILEEIYEKTGKKYSRNGKVPPRELLLRILYRNLDETLSITNGMNGKITIEYKRGVPTLMSVEFRTRDAVDNDKFNYEELKDWIGNDGYITHRGIGLPGKIIQGLKEFPYVEDTWNRYGPTRAMSKKERFQHHDDIIKGGNDNNALEK